MKSNVFIIMKKEFARFFGDRRMLFTALIMPGLMMYILYSLMGSLMSNITGMGEGQTPVVYVCEMPESIRTLAASAEDSPEIRDVGAGQLGTIKDQIKNMEADLLVVFPSGFDALAAAYDMRSGQPAPNIEVYYNSSSLNSDSLYQGMLAALNQYQYSLYHNFDVNHGNGPWDLAEPGASASDQMLTAMLPLLLMIFMFSSCVTLAPESIAGEKERGTIATLLVTPIRSGELAAGKILSLAITALLCGISSAAGAILGMNQMMSATGAGISFGAIGAKEYMLLLLVILSSILLTITLISLISAFAKSVKEANSTALPLLLVSIMGGLLPMITGGGAGGFYHYLIPIYNTSKCLNDLFLMDYDLVNILISIISCIAYAGIGSFALAKMFRSEKIMMSK